MEALFAELKNQIGLRRLRLRRMKFVREQFFLAAAAQNIKRLVRFLNQQTQPPAQATGSKITFLMPESLRVRLGSQGFAVCGSFAKCVLAWPFHILRGHVPHSERRCAE